MGLFLNVTLFAYALKKVLDSGLEGLKHAV